MAHVSVFKPFKAYRPSPEYAKEVASKPYDVLNSKEARIEAEGHEMSFLHVVKPEIDLPEDVDPYSHEVYLKGKANFNDLIVSSSCEDLVNLIIENQRPDNNDWTKRLGL